MIQSVRRLMLDMFAASAMSLTGCSSSIEPLSDAKTSIPDLRLVGTWEFDGPTGRDIAVISRQKDASNVLEAIGKDERLKLEKKANLFCTKLGDNCFISIEIGDDDKRDYVIAKYEFLTDDTIKLSRLDEQFFGAAVKSNQLKGKSIYSISADGQRIFQGINLKDTADNLRMFIEKHGAKCFNESPTPPLKRIKKNEEH